MIISEDIFQSTNFIQNQFKKFGEYQTVKIRISEDQNRIMSISEFESRPIQNHKQQATYKCYFRLPNMKAVVYNVLLAQTVNGLKQIAKKVFDLDTLSSEQEVKLIVNEVQLQEGMDLSVELFNNAIIHVIVPQKKSHKNVQQQTQEEQQQTITLRIKEPSVKCPILTLPWIPLRLTIKSLKSRILQFYRRQYFDEKISKLEEEELYLVYGGRVLIDDKMLEDYDVNEDGVVYVVNGREYVRVMTKQEAEKRINEIKGRVKEVNEKQETSNQIQEANNQIQINKKQRQENTNQQPFIQSYQQSKQLSQYQSQQVQKQQNQIKQSQVLNIIQSIVHDEDSQVEEETDDFHKPQKFIQRYDSKTGNIIEDNYGNKDVDEFLPNQQQQLTQQTHLQQSTPNSRQVESTPNHLIDESKNEQNYD